MAEQDREIGSLEQASALITEWEAAYEDLKADHLRLMHRYVVAKQDLAQARYAIECDLWLEEQHKPVKSECPF